MDTGKFTKRIYWAAESLLLACAVGAAAWLSRDAEWQPLPLVALLLALTLVGQWLSIDTHRGQLSASFVALVLTMSLLGPAPAVAFGVAAMVLASSRRRLRPAFWLGNLTTFAVGLLIGGLLVRALAGDVHDPGNHQMTQGITFALIVFAVFLVVTGLNLVLVALDLHFAEDRPIRSEIRELFLPLLPGQLATGALATILAVAYTNLGLPLLYGAVVVLLIFRQLTVSLLRSEDRAEQLEARSRQLVGLQLGVLRTLVRALGMRDKTSARHVAAVASYSKALAQELDYSEEEQEVIHVAGLLHDIGKFTWPDRILHAEVLKDEDMATVKDHPQEGAIIVGALDGYGEVADAILYHHERVDGGGYPAGLIGKEIPLASRIVAICSTYDRMTASHGYNPPITPEQAIDELRNAARNGQLDAELVESFIALLERKGPTFAEDADFETELDFERRVRGLAERSSTDPASSPSPTSSPSRSRLRGRNWRSEVAGLRQRVLNKA